MKLRKAAKPRCGQGGQFIYYFREHTDHIRSCPIQARRQYNITNCETEWIVWVVPKNLINEFPRDERRRRITFNDFINIVKARVLCRRLGGNVAQYAGCHGNPPDIQESSRRCLEKEIGQVRTTCQYRLGFLRVETTEHCNVVCIVGCLN